MLLRAVAGVAAFVIVMMTNAAASAPGGTAITNAATATYTDGGRNYVTQSNTIAATIASVSALAVSPKNAAANPGSDGFATGATITRTFTITNTSNITDAYTVTGLTTSGGSITGVAFVTPSGLVSASGGALSPAIPPGGTIQVIVTIATAGVATGTSIAVSLTARTTVGGTQTGLVSDSGKEWAVALGSPQLAGQGSSSATIAKTVDNVVTEANAPGATVAYKITFENWGTVPAANARLTDPLPAGITADPSSVRLNGASTPATLAGNVLTVPLGTLTPQVPMTVTFTAAVANTLTIGASCVNVASLSADGAAAIATSPASVFVGTADIVYDGVKGQGAPVGGALVALVDPVTKQPIANLAASSTRQSRAVTASVLNPQNANPFRTGADGAYGFTIAPPTPGTTATFDLLIQATGYVNRDIGVTLTPDASGFLYTVSLTAKDGQPLAHAGGFDLITTNVQLQNVFSLLGNLPLFTASSIRVTKTADKTQAAPGDRIAFTIGFAASGASTLANATLTDTMPGGLAYAPGTARLDGAAIEPVHAGAQLIWPVAQLAPGAPHTLSYEAVVLPTVPGGTMLTNTVGIAATIDGTKLGASGFGSVSVVVVGGAFSAQTVVTGRVFVDDAGRGRFVPPDRVLPGVRLTLENGESVVTDANGRFSFPGVRGGMHVLRLDETTVPPIARAFDDRAYDSERSPIRLVHGIFDLGLLHDVNFALEPVR